MYENSQSEAPGLDEYLRALRSRWWVVIATAVIGVIAASLFVSSRTPSYEAQATITLGPSPSGGSIDQPAPPDAATETDKLQSTAVAQAVAETLAIGDSTDELLDGLSVAYVTGRNVLDVTYTSGDPETAQSLANAFANEYSAKRDAEAVAVYTVEIARLNAVVDSGNEQIAAINTQINQNADAIRVFDRREGTLTSEQQATYNELQAANSRLSTERDALESTRRNALQRASEYEGALQTRAKAAEVTRGAALPTAPIGVSDNVVKLGGLLLGLLAGVVIAFTLARLDGSATDAGEVEEATGAPVLANVPAFRRTRTSGVSGLVMVTNSRSLRIQRARESYRRLRTSMQLLVTKSGRNSILVTSAHPSEGKSVTAANLAIANAQAGKRTVLVSADLRRPSLERLLSVPNDKGLSDWLAEETEAVVQELPSIPNLSVIVAGNQLDGPGELLASPRLAALVDDLEAEFDLVILDTPPVLATADAATVAGAVGGVMFVIDGRRTDLQVLRMVTGEINRSGGKILGTVLNRTKSQPGHSMLRRDAYAYEREARKRLD